MPNHTYKPILSISLLCSNRKDTTKKCLDSLKMIMDQVDSELIIVDTGCDDEMKALLQNYTDRIIPFTWCNDFSKARNAGLEKCSGEWFLYIDDDEWFDNVDEIVDFFQTGEYKNYSQAHYLQRNYHDLDGKTYEDSWVSRMTQLQKETHFCSSIHEYIEPRGEKHKLLHSYVNHYGYIFRSTEDKYRHSKRNITLLMDMIKKERGNLRWWAQLAQEYRGIEEYTKLIDLCVEGIEFIKKENHPYINAQRGVFYAGKLKAEIETFLLEDAAKDYKVFIKDKRNTDVCRAMLFSQGTEIFYRLNNYSKAKECARKYVGVYERWIESENTDERILREGSFFTREAFTPSTKIPVYGCLISCCLKEDDPSALKQYFDELGWEEEVLKVSPLICKDIIQAFSVLEYEEEFPPIAETLINRKEMTDSVVAELKEIEKVGEEKYDRLLTIFSKVDSPHFYVWYMKLQYADRENDRELLQEVFTNLLGCVNDIFNLDGRVWEIAERRSVNLDQIFLQISFDQWKRGVDYFCEKTTLEELTKIRRIVEKAKKTPDIRFDYFDLKAKEAALVYGESRDQYEQLWELLKDFCNSSIRFYGNIYQPFAFQGEMEFLPASCRLAVRLKQVFDAEEQTLAKETVCALEKCLGIFPSLDAPIQAYIQLYGDNEKERLNRLLKQQSLTQVAELLGAVGEAIEYLKMNPNPELQTGVQIHRKTVENLLAQYTGDPVQKETVDFDNLSDEDWLREMNQILLKKQC